MGKATSMAHRERVVSLKKEGHSFEAISEQLSLSRSNVRDIWTRYRKQGEAGLATAYANCGPKGPKTPPLLRRAALWLKRQHPAWGTPRIHCGLRSRYGDATPSIRTLNRWYAAEGLVKPRSRDARERIGAARAVHNTWQADAKENLVLADGQPACYLTIVDEKSGAWLDSLVFPASGRPATDASARCRPNRCVTRWRASLGAGASAGLCASTMVCRWAHPRRRRPRRWPCG